MKLSADRIRSMTLARQFPRIRGRGRSALVELFGRLGPVQSQVPRAPFLAAASRLPGIGYRTISDALTDGDLLKGTNLRGTVHTSTPGQFPAADAVSRSRRAGDLRRVFGLSPEQVQQLISEIEAYCGSDWRQRDLLVDLARQWLRRNGAADGDGELDRGMPANLIWGHSGLIRRPKDGRWERRTDTLHRTAYRIVDGLTMPPTQPALTELARVHLSCYGPADRRDIAWWLGVPLGPVDRALADLEPELVHHSGPDDVELVDLASAPTPRSFDPGPRLLPEFDGLLLGYHPAHRTRFLDQDHLARIWKRANGQFLGGVLVEGRIVGCWRTEPGRPTSATVVEVRPFTTGAAIGDDVLRGPLSDAERALELTVAEVRMLPG